VLTSEERSALAHVLPVKILGKYGLHLISLRLCIAINTVLHEGRRCLVG